MERVYKKCILLGSDCTKTTYQSGFRVLSLYCNPRNYQHFNLVFAFRTEPRVRVFQILLFLPDWIRVFVSPRNAGSPRITHALFALKLGPKILRLALRVPRLLAQCGAHYSFPSLHSLPVLPSQEELLQAIAWTVLCYNCVLRVPLAC